MRHTDLKQLCTLAGGLARADGRQRAKIPGNCWPVKMGRIYRTSGHPVGDVAVIELPRNAPSQAP